MKIFLEDVEKIIIYSRGQNRDEYGNPYYAYKCIVRFKWDRDHTDSELVIRGNADWGSSGKEDVFQHVRHKLERTFGLQIDWREQQNGLVTHYHKTVRKHESLYNIDSWKLPKED